MATPTHLLSGDFSAIVGEARSLKAYVFINSDDGGWVDETDLVVRLGGVRLAVSATGTFSQALPTSTGTGLQYNVRAEYTDPASRAKKTWDSGWFPLTAASNLAERAANSTLHVSQSKAAELGDLVQGYADHGNVSGAVSINPAIGTHVLDATGATVLTLGAAADGAIVTVLVASGASNVTVTDPAGAELTDGGFVTFVHIRGSWVLAAAGGTAGPPDATPPTAVTDLSATGGIEQIVLDWSPATDPDSSVSYRYRAWLTSGGASGAWTTTAASAATITGLTAGAYTAEVYAYSGGGASATDTDTATVAADLGYDIGDDFNTSNTTTNNGRTTTVGAKTWTTPWTADIGSGAVGIASGKAYGVSNGAARVPTSQQNYVVRCTYSVPGGASTTQVRVYARGLDAGASGSFTASVNAFIRGSGALWVAFGSNDGAAINLGNSQPTSGIMALEVIGTTGRVLINGTQVGSTFSITGITGPNAGVGFYDAVATVDNFEVEYL